MSSETEEDGVKEMGEEVVKSICSISQTTSGAIQIYIGGSYGFADKVLEGLPTSVTAGTKYRANYYPRLKKIEITGL